MQMNRPPHRLTERQTYAEKRKGNSRHDWYLVERTAVRRGLTATNHCGVNIYRSVRPTAVATGAKAIDLILSVYDNGDDNDNDDDCDSTAGWSV